MYICCWGPNSSQESTALDFVDCSTVPSVRDDCACLGPNALLPGLWPGHKRTPLKLAHGEIRGISHSMGPESQLAQPTWLKLGPQQNNHLFCQVSGNQREPQKSKTHKRGTNAGEANWFNQASFARSPGLERKSTWEVSIQEGSKREAWFSRRFPAVRFLRCLGLQRLVSLVVGFPFDPLKVSPGDTKRTPMTKQTTFQGPKKGKPIVLRFSDRRPCGRSAPRGHTAPPGFNAAPVFFFLHQLVALRESEARCCGPCGPAASPRPSEPSSEARANCELGEGIPGSPRPALRAEGGYPDFTS